MADTKPHDDRNAAPTEADGISYVGIGWFVVILTATTLVCMAIVWGMFEWMSSREASREAARSPLASPVVTPSIEEGRVLLGGIEPQPGILVVESTVLLQFQENEEAELTTYGWVDENTGTMRIPIERAKALLLERGLPTRDQ
jgi:hypothetical protein